MADDYIGFRVPVEVRQQLLQLCAMQGMSLSDYCRSILVAALNGTGYLAGVDEGYTQARSLAAQLARYMLDHARATLPETYAEAHALGIFNGAGPPES